jgi:Zn-dependent protease
VQNRGASLRFGVFGIPVEVEAVFFVVIALFGWTGSGEDLLIWVVVAFVSILLHEFGHAVAARLLGSPASVRLYGFGGVTNHNRLTPVRDLAITLAGPFAGLAFGVAAWRWAEMSGASGTAIDTIVWINVGWSLVNLLPILPLDGGNAVSGLIKIVTGRDGESIARRLSIVAAGGLALLAFTNDLIYSGIFALILAGMNVSALRERKEAPLHDRIANGYRALNERDPAQAVDVADEVLAQRPTTSSYVAALLLKAWALTLLGRVEEATAAVDALPPEAHPPHVLRGVLALGSGDADRGLALLVDGYLERTNWPVEVIARYLAEAGQTEALARRLLLLDVPERWNDVATLQTALHYTGRYPDAAAVGAVLFEAGDAATAPMAAYNVACSLARNGDEAGALQWLERAVSAGFADIALIDRDKDLESMRAHPEFVALRRRAS